jgi:hypothetical protein
MTGSEVACSSAAAAEDGPNSDRPEIQNGRYPSDDEKRDQENRDTQQRQWTREYLVQFQLQAAGYKEDWNHEPVSDPFELCPEPRVSRGVGIERGDDDAGHKRAKNGLQTNALRQDDLVLRPGNTGPGVRLLWQESPLLIEVEVQGDVVPDLGE